MIYSNGQTWRIGFKGDYPMWAVIADSPEDAIRQIVELYDLDKDELEAK